MFAHFRTCPVLARPLRTNGPPHRKQRSLPTRESASQSLDLLQRRGQIVVDRPAIGGVVAQGPTQPPALEFQVLGGWTRLEWTQVQAEIVWQPLGENAVEPAS